MITFSAENIVCFWHILFLLDCAYVMWYSEVLHLDFVFNLSCFSWQRDCGRPPVPRKDPGVKPEEEGLLSSHPYVDKVLQAKKKKNLYE